MGPKYACSSVGLFKGIAMAGVLYGIGVGPGDPKLLTIRATEVLKCINVLVYPNFGDRKLSAHDIIKPFLVDGIVKLEMKIPFAPPKERLLAYNLNIVKIKEYLDQEFNVGVICEGDPLFFGSFINIWEPLKDKYKVEVIPGVSSVMSAFPEINEYIAIADESVSIITSNLTEELIMEKIRHSNTTIIMKIGKKFAKIRKILEVMGLSKQAIYISNISRPNQMFSRIDLISNMPEEYFSMIIIKNNDL